MTAIGWLALPLVALVLALVWAAWSGRRPRSDMHETVAAHQRFTATLGRCAHPAKDAGSDDRTGWGGDRDHRDGDRGGGGGEAS